MEQVKRSVLHELLPKYAEYAAQSDKRGFRDATTKVIHKLAQLVLPDQKITLTPITTTEDMEKVQVDVARLHQTYQEVKEFLDN